MSRHYDAYMRANTLLKQWDLLDHRETKVHDLAYGDRRKLEIAVTFGSLPKVLLLDEPSNGLTSTELGLSYLLPRAIGSSRAFEIMLTGRDVDAAEADRIGLVSSVVPPGELLDASYQLAERISSFSRPGTELTKRLMWSSFEAGSLHGHMEAEGTAQLFVRITTQNFEEAIRARKEKRPPEFKD